MGYTTSAVHTPVHSVVSSPLVSALTPAATLKTVHTPVTYSVPAVHTVASSPLVHHTYAVPTVAKTVVPHVTVAKTVDHGVVGTYAGLVHSSHAGICLNNVGVQVPC